MTPGRALYLYAAVPGGTALDALRGVGDEPVEVLAVDGLGLAVSDVMTAELAAATAESADPRLVGALAQRHDSVVRAVAASTAAVLPFRLGTVVTDRPAVHRFLTSRAVALRAQLDRVAGCDEWGVTVREDDGPAVQAAGQPGAETGTAETGTGETGTADPNSTQAGAGTAYLTRRRQHFQRLEQRRRTALELVAEVETALGEVARDTATGRRQADLLLDRAYLVPRDEQPRFVEVLDRCGDRLAAHGFALRVTGPWPPYSFVDLTVVADG
jgi:hypothetical protein